VTVEILRIGQLAAQKINRTKKVIFFITYIYMPTILNQYLKAFDLQLRKTHFNIFHDFLAQLRNSQKMLVIETSLH